MPDNITLMPGEGDGCNEQHRHIFLQVVDAAKPVLKSYRVSRKRYVASVLFPASMCVHRATLAYNPTSCLLTLSMGIPLLKSLTLAEMKMLMRIQNSAPMVQIDPGILAEGLTITAASVCMDPAHAGVVAREMKRNLDRVLSDDRFSGLSEHSL